MAEIEAKRLPNAWLALGLACHFLARRDPFGQFRAGELVQTVHGQIQRGHYLFALDRATDPARVVGYIGWALYPGDVAERFAAGGQPPPVGTGGDGDVVFVLTAAAEHRRAFFAMVKAGRALYPHNRTMAVRHKPGRRVLLDQWRARSASRRNGG